MAAKRTSSTPASEPAGKKTKVRKRRWYHKTWDVYKMTVRHDPNVRWWMLGAFVGTVLVFVLAGWALDSLWAWLILSIPTALMVALIIMGRRAEAAAYSQIEGRPGASVAALDTIKRGWTVEKEPAAADPRTQDLVFRAIGRPGVVLIGEGPPHRVGKLLDAEKKRVAKALPNVPIHLVQVGRDEGQVPLAKLIKTIRKLKRTLTAAETAEVVKRLRALKSVRPPVPKGIDPLRARPDRRGMRGR